MADDSKIHIDTAASIALHLSRLPAELRIEIYNHIFEDLSLETMLQKPYTLQIVAPVLRRYVTRLKNHSGFLYASRQILHEALPIYRKFLIHQIDHLRKIPRELITKWKELTSSLLPPGPELNHFSLVKLRMACQDLMPKLTEERSRVSRLILVMRNGGRGRSGYSSEIHKRDDRNMVEVRAPDLA